MCLACEEAELFYRFELLKQIAEGKMPEGITEDELRAMDLPLPGEIEIVIAPDGTKTLRPVKLQPAAFACDSPST